MKKRAADLLHRRRKPPVAQPLADAELRYGIPFLQKKTVSLWEKEISRHTTRDFARIGSGYRRHCGPTAITNLILTLHRRYRYLKPPAEARDIFTEVSAIGRKKGIYWNTDFLRFFGGTYDILTRLYITDCLRHYQIPLGAGKVGEPDPLSGDSRHRVTVSGRFFASKSRAVKALNEGKLLYLQLLHHPVYGNHHLLCCGYTVLSSVTGGKKEMYLILADGWSASPRYLRMSGIGIWHFLEIN